MSPVDLIAWYTNAITLSVSLPLYVILQIWFACAWAGRWRLVALVPLAGLIAYVVTEFVGFYLYAPVVGQSVLGQLLVVFVTTALFSPLGSILLVMLAVARVILRRPAAV
jgi:hypothetical protein